MHGCPPGTSKLGRAPAARSRPTAALVPSVMREPGEMGSVPVVEDAPPKESAPPLGRQAVFVQGVLSECFRNPAVLREELLRFEDLPEIPYLGVDGVPVTLTVVGDLY